MSFHIILFSILSWAVSTVMTRQNIIPVVSKKVSEEDGQPRSQPENEVSKKKLHALIPLWDLCNHEDGKVNVNHVTCLYLHMMIINLKFNSPYFLVISLFSFFFSPNRYLHHHAHVVNDLSLRTPF